MPVRFKNRTTRILALSFLVILGCAKVPYTEREQLMILSLREESEIGEKTFEQVKKGSRLNTDPFQNDLIKKVGLKIAGAAARPDFQWEFILIDTPQVNAFALPGGKVAFYTGILPFCRDEIGVAVVMGHEVAHVLARHGAERLSQQQILAVGQSALLAALYGQSPAAREAVGAAYGFGSTVALTLPFSRKHESEADEIGLILMAKAGYDPHAAVDFWKRMSEQKKGPAMPDFLSTHPSDRRRIEKIESFLPKAMGYYRK